MRLSGKFRVQGGDCQPEQRDECGEGDVDTEVHGINLDNRRENGDILAIWTAEAG